MSLALPLRGELVLLCSVSIRSTVLFYLLTLLMPVVTRVAVTIAIFGMSPVSPPLIVYVDCMTRSSG